MSNFRIIKNPEWTKEEQDEFMEDIKENSGYCPCNLIKDKDHKCICLDFKKQEYAGECTCGLFIKE